ncbi:hypothetical protein D0Z00_000508 [Geotrichum galactomycetum]|uniref:Uncharacterized protein n=1 Tax=Geotrichum galactomycetum TaxID=27317 RepID=A0ACB6V9I7_9ASCO|nr:hypothetical protein D0Z00_000508 [Geotrichum candidum]
MNEKEIEHYNNEKVASTEKISRLDVKTLELQTRLSKAQTARAHREEYSKFADDFFKSRKFEIDARKLSYDLNEGRQSPSNTPKPIENDDKMDLDDANNKVIRSVTLNISRDKAKRINSGLIDEISELEARKEMYERTWNQRKDNFQEILEGLQRFRSQVLEEKMEQERQEEMNEEDNEEANDEEVDESESVPSSSVLYKS